MNECEISGRPVLCLSISSSDILNSVTVTSTFIILIMQFSSSLLVTLTSRSLSVYMQTCHLETYGLELEFTRDLKAKVLISRPGAQGLGLEVRWLRSWS